MPRIPAQICAPRQNPLNRPGRDRKPTRPAAWLHPPADRARPGDGRGGAVDARRLARGGAGGRPLAGGLPRRAHGRAAGRRTAASGSPRRCTRRTRSRSSPTPGGWPASPGARASACCTCARARPPSARWIAARLSGRPWLATYHGAYPAKSGLKRWYNSVMTRGELVIANSDFTARHLLANHAVDRDKVVIIPRGADFARFDPDAIAPERIAKLQSAWGVDPADPRAEGAAGRPLHPAQGPARAGAGARPPAGGRARRRAR